jgi:proteasome lid subunit RPN8/RPN11
MVGERLEGGRGPVVLVEAVIPGAHTDARRGSVTFTHETWEQINQEKDQNYSDLRIVGWYHTHPGFGIFLSDYDEFIQANFFNLPWNIAFVLDPLSGESGAFGWVGGKIARLPEYESYAVADEHPPHPAERPEEEGAPEAVEPPAEAAPVGRGAIRWVRVFAAVAAVLLLLIIVLSTVVTWLMIRQAHPQAPPPVTARPAPAPAPPPGAANTLAPAAEPSASAQAVPAPPAAEATPPPEASNQVKPPAPEPPHEPATSEKSGT